MAGKSREIKGRIKAVGNIERITKTMQMIATARFQKLQKRATSAKPYADKVHEVVGELGAALGGEGSASHPLLQKPDPPAGRELLLVITSDRGLCGAYNTNVLRRAMTQLRGKEDQTRLEVVGKKGGGFFKFNGVTIDEQVEGIGDSPSYERVAELAESYMQRFTAGELDAVRIVSMEFITMGQQKPRLLTLLPLEPPPEAPDAPDSDAGVADGSANAAAAFGGGVYEFEPDPGALLDQVLPLAVKTTLLQAFNEAAVSEQIARMIAMKSATDAASKMKKNLKREFNRARQTAITTELTEIIGGAAALE
jgi:F-type H+-transporting ATPase subunit gamma